MSQSRTDTARAPLLLPLAGLVAAVALAGCDRPVDSEALVAPTQPMARHTPPPEYPVELACYDVGGTVELIMEVGLDGRPQQVRVERSSGQPALDEAALAAVREWEFTPGTRGGQPVASDLRVPVTFRPPTERPQMCNLVDEQR